MKRLLIAVLGVILVGCASSRQSAPLTAEQANALVLRSSCLAASSATNALAGAYICDEVTALKVYLVIKQDGTYEASVERPAGARVESGVWTNKGDDLVLERRSGDIGHPIRRLRPDHQISGRLFWIVPGGGEAGGAATYPIFHREVL
jgi:hypothetical protein